jgi:hypothetical protein
MRYLHSPKAASAKTARTHAHTQSKAKQKKALHEETASLPGKNQITLMAAPSDHAASTLFPWWYTFFMRVTTGSRKARRRQQEGKKAAAGRQRRGCGMSGMSCGVVV